VVYDACQPADPIHAEVGDPGVAWTTGNVSEAFPGVCTPLMWTFAGPTAEAAVRRMFHRLGVLRADELAVPARVEDRLLVPFHGRFAANVNVFRDLVDRMPGMSADQVEEQLLGGVRSGVESHPTRRRYPAIALRMPVAVARLLPTVRQLRTSVDGWWRTSLQTSSGLGTPGLRTRLLEARERFGELIGIQTLVSMLASGAYEQVVNLATRAGVPELAPRLLSGLGSIAEGGMLDDLWSLSRDRITLAAFLADHGYHGLEEGQISGRPWREKPAPLLALAERHRQLSEADHPRVLQQRQAADHVAAVAELVRRLPAWRRPAARALLRYTAAVVPAREVGKAAFLQAVDVGRDSARRLGAALASTGHLEDAEDVFLLTLDELTSPDQGELKAMVAARRPQWERHARVRLPEHWTGMPVPEASPAAPGTIEVLHGIAASPGVAAGRARVITDWSTVECEPGEIIVCQGTDPALAALLPLAAGVATDLGGVLAHAAIVARELGVPCVVHTRTATSNIVTGDAVEVDGTAGIVRRRSPRPEAQ
jgi:pyruvate,water dikinase